MNSIDEENNRIEAYNLGREDYLNGFVKNNCMDGYKDEYEAEYEAINCETGEIIDL